MGSEQKEGCDVAFISRQTADDVAALPPFYTRGARVTELSTKFHARNVVPWTINVAVLRTVLPVLRCSTSGLQPRCREHRKKQGPTRKT